MCRACVRRDRYVTIMVGGRELSRLQITKGLTMQSLERTGGSETDEDNALGKTAEPVGSQGEAGLQIPRYLGPVGKEPGRRGLENRQRQMGAHAVLFQIIRSTGRRENTPNRAHGSIGLLIEEKFQGVRHGRFSA